LKLFCPLTFFFGRPDPASPKNLDEVLKLGAVARRYPKVLIVNRPTQPGVNQRNWTRTALSVGAVFVALVIPTVGGVSVAHATPKTSADQTFSSAKKTSSLPRLGDKGQAVRSLQQALTNQGITLRGGVDGVFGQGTLNAVKTFQSSKGLIASGEVNSTTAFLLGLAPSPILPARGQRGALVTTLQQALTRASITVRGGVDGIFGAGTTAAVTTFQTNRGLTATGIVDITTAIALGIVDGSATTTTPAPVTTTAPTTTPVTTTAPTTTGQFPVVGDVNDAVKTLQKSLIAAGVTVRGGADGRFGPGTTAAVTTFQQNMRIAATGVVDQLTAQLLGLSPAPALPKMGDTGDAVKALQNALLTAGVTVKGGADGRFGAATKNSITAFQKAQGLTATGVLDLRSAIYVGFVAGLTTPNTNPSVTTTIPTAPTTVPSASATLPTVFPVLGPCWFADTWQAPRSGGRSHEGVDIIAKSGTPLYAVANGTITRIFLDRPGSLGGNAVRLTAADGTYFHYAHLSAFADGAGLGATVVAGQVIGYVGSTGSSSTPHLHFEYHPGGGAAVNPFPVIKPLDACKSTTPPTTAPATTTTTTTATTPSA
jgi:peptidoglycan hydrolase-like protein with peptidoglycan-binding domain